MTKLLFTVEKGCTICNDYIDYRGLIPMGLAVDATNLNIY